uniref:NTR domain-containing protein n=1 Tax=Periophthalmus magnuspinnatus TaxID=409849 RepID=A0A3B4AZN7_9GOBI
LVSSSVRPSLAPSICGVFPLPLAPPPLPNHIINHTAVQAHILKADKAGEWWKFTVNIISVYKQGESRIRRGDQFLWVRAKDVACKCPKIKPGKKYLLLGSDEASPGQGGVVADKGSLVIQWRDTWARRLRKFQQREKKGKCKKP